MLLCGILKKKKKNLRLFYALIDTKIGTAISIGWSCISRFLFHHHNYISFHSREHYAHIDTRTLVLSRVIRFLTDENTYNEM